MKAIKIIIKNYDLKKGGNFTKATIKGKFLPLVLAEEETYYQVRFIGKDLPKEEGVYQVSYEENDLWIDTRPEFVDKHIVRVRPVRVLFDKKLEANK